MNKIIGFLIGHYDSRGGTVFIGGDDEEEAKKLLRKSFMINEDNIDMIWAHDLLGRAVLNFPHDYTPRSGIDLEEEGRVLVEDADGHLTLNWDEEDEENDFITAVPGNVHLEFVPRGGQPVTLRGCHPRWNDDAFGFLIIKEENIKPGK